MKNLVEIFLNHPNQTYYSGQTVKGKLILNCPTDTKIQNIWFSLIGYGKFPSSFLQDDANFEPNMIQLMKFYIFDSKCDKCLKLKKGSTIFHFSFKLKQNLITSLNSNDLAYKLKFVIDKPWKLNKVYKIPIHSDKLLCSKK